MPYISPVRLADIGSGVGFPGSCWPPPAVLARDARRVAAAACRGRGRGRGGGPPGCERLVQCRCAPRSVRDPVRCRDRARRRVAGRARGVRRRRCCATAGGSSRGRGRGTPPRSWAGRRPGRVVGLSLDRVVAVEPFPGAHSRHLHFYVKTAPDAGPFPRRPGMARKRARSLAAAFPPLLQRRRGRREGGDGSVPNCYGMPPNSDRLRH